MRLKSDRLELGLSVDHSDDDVLSVYPFENAQYFMYFEQVFLYFLSIFHSDCFPAFYMGILIKFC